jgi:hypothetical protein
MTNSIGVNSGGPLHESQATLYGIVGNAAVKLTDVALAQLHFRPELSGACANMSLRASLRT